MSRLFIAPLAVIAFIALSLGESLNDGPATAQLVANPAGPGVVTRRVFEGPDLEFWGAGVSPGGRYLSQVSEGYLAVLDLITGQLRSIAPAGAPMMSTISPDGNRIAYTTVWEGLYQIRVMGIDGSGDRRLWQEVPAEASGIDPADVQGWPEVYGWSGDGAAVLMAVYGNGGTQIALLPLDGSPRRVLYRPARGKGPSKAALSHDGRFLAFDENIEVSTPDMPNPEVDIFVLSLEGGGRPVPVAPNPSHDELVGWTDDGRLLLASERDLTEGVWSIEIRNGRPVGDPTLVKGDLWGMYPIGMAGNTVFYGVGTQFRQVHTVGLSIQGRRLVGSLSPVEADMRPSEWPTWSPDGRRLAYKVLTGVRGSDTYESLVIRTAAGQEAQEIDLEHVAGTSRGIRWGPGGGEVYLRGSLRAEEGMRGFAALDLGSGEARTLYTVEEAPGCRPNVEFHPDGRRAFCIRRNADHESMEVAELDLASFETRLVWRLPDGSSETDRIGMGSLSPDGSRLAFWKSGTSSPASAGEKRSLNVLSVEGGEPRELLSLDVHAGQYADCSGSEKALWTPDGQQLLIAIPETVEEGGKAGPDACPLYLVPVSGGDPVKIGALPEHSQWAMSPDGTRLAAVAGEPRGEIWVLEGAGR